MDTLSHSIMGIGISIMAIEESGLPDDYKPLVYVAIIGASSIPDIDAVTKLGGNKSYINQHRGFTHSLLFLPILVLLLNFITNVFFPNEYQNILLPWIALAVTMHLITDIFNNYGIKLLWPFKDKWLSINATYTIDFFIIGLFLIGMPLYYIFNLNGLILYSALLLVTIVYLIVLMFRSMSRREYIKANLSNIKKAYVTSKSQPHQWKFVAQTHDGIYRIGELRGKKIQVLDSQVKHRRIDQDIYDAVKDDKNLKIFLKFSKVYNWDISRFIDYTEVRVKDLTYYAKIGTNYVYLFNCVIYVDNETMEIQNSYVGFTTGDKSLYHLIENRNGPIKNILKKIGFTKKEVKNNE